MGRRTTSRKSRIAPARARLAAVVLGTVALALVFSGCFAQRAEIDAQVNEGPPPADADFSAFWDVSTAEEASQIQESVDAGEDAWRKDPAMVAERFAKDFAGWEKIEVTDPTTSGSSETGWSAEVTFRPVIGEGAGVSGAAHHLVLVGIEGSEEPAWFVMSLASDNIEVDTPKNLDAISSPLRIAGRGTAFEATIHTEIRDDDGNSLHKGFVMAGAIEIAPFEAELEFDPASSSSGLLILTGDTGVEGPSPDMTVVRVSFS